MTFPRKSVGLYHLPTTAGSAQAYPSSPDVTVSGLLIPLDRKEHALEGGDPAVGYELYLPATTDVRVGDKAVIANVDGATRNFFVKSIFSAQFGGHPHKRVSLSYQRSGGR